MILDCVVWELGYGYSGVGAAEVVAAFSGGVLFAFQIGVGVEEVCLPIFPCLGESIKFCHYGHLVGNDMHEKSDSEEILISHSLVMGIFPCAAFFWAY